MEKASSLKKFKEQGITGRRPPGLPVAHNRSATPRCRVASTSSEGPWEATRSRSPRLPTSTGLISAPRGWCFWQTAPRPIFRNGATSGIGPRGNGPCGGCPCGEIFDSHRLERLDIVCRRQTDRSWASIRTVVTQPNTIKPHAARPVYQKRASIIESDSSAETIGAKYVSQNQPQRKRYRHARLRSEPL
jgi:hypothetical protein